MKEDLLKNNRRMIALVMEEEIKEMEEEIKEMKEILEMTEKLKSKSSGVTDSLYRKMIPRPEVL